MLRMLTQAKVKHMKWVKWTTEAYCIFGEKVNFIISPEQHKWSSMKEVGDDVREIMRGTM